MQPIARVDLARASGLQNSTVSSLVEQLLSEGWVSEGEALKTTRGRRPTQISLNHLLSMLVADVHPGRARFGVIDLNGQVLSHSEVTLPLDVEEAVRRLGSALKQMQKTYADRRFEGAGICIPGRVDVETGKVMVAPNLRWQEFDVREALAKLLGMPVEMENDANACLLSELWFGHLDGVRNAALLAISEGVGVSLLAEGRLISGRNGMAGEFGHVCFDPAGPLCNCGRRGCWEMFASCRAAIQQYKRLEPTSKRSINYEELCRLALDGVDTAREAIERQITALGQGLRMVTAALEPEVILFVGEIAHAWSIAAPILRSECKKQILAGESPQMICAGNTKDAHILGAAAVVLQRHSGYYSFGTAGSRRRSNEPAKRIEGAVVAPNRLQVASSEITRDINRDVVLGYLRALQPVSRVELARASGLQPSTVSSIVEQLLRERWIREGAVAKTARGRPPTLISLNENVAILAADVRPGRAVVALLDLSGRFLEWQVVPLGSDAQRGVATIAEVMRGYRVKHPELTFEGAGISMPGRVDPWTGRLVFSPNLPWREFNIREQLELELGLEIQLENAANASLLSEIWFGRLEGIRDAVLLTISEGVGAAILAEGRLVTGEHGMAGEFGHICVDPSGPVCGCGGRGCWEVYASSTAALRYYFELEPKAEKTTYIELVSLAIDGDGPAKEALKRQAHAIGQGLHLLNAILSPELILIAIDTTGFSEMYLAIIEEECRAGLMAGDAPRIVLTEGGDVTRLRGAAAVALQRHTGYYRATHPHSI